MLVPLRSYQWHLINQSDEWIIKPNRMERGNRSIAFFFSSRFLHPPGSSEKERLLNGGVWLSMLRLGQIWNWYLKMLCEKKGNGKRACYSMERDDWKRLSEETKLSPFSPESTSRSEKVVLWRQRNNKEAFGKWLCAWSFYSKLISIAWVFTC